MEKEDRNEGRRSYSDRHLVLERPAADADYRLYDDSKDGAFQSEEHAFDCGYVAEDHIDVAERQNREETR
ncbi:hypothetical protein D3C80_1949780 [compost metagenome]